MKGKHPLTPPPCISLPGVARLAFSHSLGEAGPPDNCVRQISTIQEAVENARGPRYGRPSDRYGLPTALFNQELAILKYDLEHLEAFTPDCPTVENAFELVCSSTAFYPERYYREMCVGGIISALLPGGTSPMLPERTADGGVKPLGAWLEGLFAYLIFRQKDEQGLEGDPFLQSLLVYSKMISEKHVKPFPLPVTLLLTCLKQYAELIPRSNLPIVLLDITGNRLEVSAAIFTNAIYADKLLSIELMLGTHARENVIRVARIFTAISKCATSLQNLYKNLRDSSDQVPGVEFPNPTPDPPGPSEEIRALRFLCKLDRVRGTELITVDVDNERHGIYLAKRSNGPSGDETVLVKFAPRYHATAHRLLADHDPPLAPALYSCTRVIGGMYMVVMEYLQDAKPLDHFFPQYPTPLPPPPDVDVVRRDLTKALDLLHKKDLVFSDLRERNVLYSPKDKGRVFLIDFDAVGEHGKDRHSPCLNTELGLGVGRWQIMEKSHDESNRDRILSWLSTTVDLARRLKAEFED